METLGRFVAAVVGVLLLVVAAAMTTAGTYVAAIGPEWIRMGECFGIGMTSFFVFALFVAAGIWLLVCAFTKEWRP